MDKILKTIIFGILLCIISYGLMLFLDYYIFIKLGDWTLPLTTRYLVFNLTSIDRALIRFFPLIVALIHISFVNKKINEYFKNVLWIFISIMTTIFIGFIIALLTWTNKSAENPFFPEFLKYQPFKYYWTIFIVFGLMVSIFYFYVLKKKITPRNN